jgi:hypothetical protein
MRRRDSGGIAKFVIYSILLVTVIGGIFLATWDMPAPTTQIQETISNARFQK